MRKEAELELLAKVLKSKAVAAFNANESTQVTLCARLLACVEWCLNKHTPSAAIMEAIVSETVTILDRDEIERLAALFDTHFKIEVGGKCTSIS